MNWQYIKNIIWSLRYGNAYPQWRVAGVALLIIGWEWFWGDGLLTDLRLHHGLTPLVLLDSVGVSFMMATLPSGYPRR